MSNFESDKSAKLLYLKAPWCTATQSIAQAFQSSVQADS